MPGRRAVGTGGLATSGVALDRDAPAGKMRLACRNTQFAPHQILTGLRVIGIDFQS